MPGFPFDRVQSGLMEGTLPLPTSTFYAHIVIAIPTAATQTVAGLTLASGGSYSPKALTGLSLGDHGTGYRLTFATPQWTGLWLGAATSMKGIVVCRQIGGSPASTDWTISYCEFNNPIVPATDANSAVDFSVPFGAEGALKLD